MTDLLKKTFAFRLFLRIRVRTFSDEKLKIQLSKRGHSLDKAIGENRNLNLYTLTLENLLWELARRKISADDITRWAWDLIYKARFPEHTPSCVRKSQQIQTNQGADLTDAIKNRRSIRKWHNKKVDLNKIRDAIDLAQWAPPRKNVDNIVRTAI